jgi:WD40 repeat protein
VWDADTGTLLTGVAGHSDVVNAVTVLPGPDGRYRIVSGDDRHSVLTWKPGPRNPGAAF